MNHRKKLQAILKMGYFRDFCPRLVPAWIHGFYWFQSWSSISHLIFKRKKISYFWKALLNGQILARWKDTLKNVLAHLFPKIIHDFCHTSCQKFLKNVVMSRFFTHASDQKMAYAPPKTRLKINLNFRKKFFQNDFCRSSHNAELSAKRRIWKIIWSILKLQHWTPLTRTNCLHY